jgi:hypothetical protein
LVRVSCRLTLHLRQQRARRCPGLPKPVFGHRLEVSHRALPHCQVIVHALLLAVRGVGKVHDSHTGAAASEGVFWSVSFA